MPSRTMGSPSTASNSLDFGDDNFDQHLKRLEPYLLNRTEHKQAATRKHPRPSSARTNGTSSSSKSSRRPAVRRFLRSQFHLLTFAIIHVFFSLYIRIRQAYHAVVAHIISVFAYHHNTPELIQQDVGGLGKIPHHLSVILKLEDHGRGAGLETLINEVSDIAAWSACAGIPVLSVYEKTGILKSYLPGTHRAVSQKLSLFFGRQKPALSLGAPHMRSISAPSTASPSSSDTDTGTNGLPNPGDGPVPHLQIILLSAEDGRDSIVDLTKTLSEMSQRGKISPEDVSVDVIDAELKEGVISEPDLLVMFGPYPDLNGYPPWQLRLTEIFSVKDNSGVGYQIFLKGLYKYSRTEMRLGR